MGEENERTSINKKEKRKKTVKSILCVSLRKRRASQAHKDLDLVLVSSLVAR